MFYQDTAGLVSGAVLTSVEANELKAGGVEGPLTVGGTVSRITSSQSNGFVASNTHVHTYIYMYLFSVFSRVVLHHSFVAFSFDVVYKEGIKNLEILFANTIMLCAVLGRTLLL